MPESLHKDTILQKLSDRKQPLSGFGVTQIGLFGSFLRKENKPDKAKIFFHSMAGNG